MGLSSVRRLPAPRTLSHIAVSFEMTVSSSSYAVPDALEEKKIRAQFFDGVGGVLASERDARSRGYPIPMISSPLALGV